MNITQLGRVIIPVSDQDKALEFYTGKLDFEVRADAPMGDGNRWLEVAPTGSSASVALMPPRLGAPHTDQACLGFGSKHLDAAQAEHVDRIEAGRRVAGPVRLAFEVSDSEKTAERLVEAGAEQVAPPVTPPWGGRNARVRSPDGMQLTLFTDE